MVLNNDDGKLNIVMKFKVDDFDNTIFVPTEMMKCFGQEAHLVHNCPDKVLQPEQEPASNAQGADS